MSINNMMSVFTILTLLVVLKDCSGHAIKGCNPGEHKDVGRSELGYKFKCVNIPRFAHVAWLITTLDPSNNHQTKVTLVELCYLKNKKCSTRSDFSSAVKKGNTSVLYYSPGSLNYTIGVTCRVFDNILTEGTSYLNDYTCNVTLADSPKMLCKLVQASDNNAEASCHIENILDPTTNYRCLFTERLANGSYGRLLEMTEGSYTFIMQKETSGPSTADCSFKYPTTLGITALQVKLVPYNVLVSVEL